MSLVDTYTLRDIHVYPVKSLAGLRVDQWPVDKRGLKFDRKWMLVDADQRFLSQRRLPEMALIHTAFEADHLVLSSADGDSIRLPLASAGHDRINVSVWHDRCSAETVDPAVDQWLSDHLKTACRLVAQPNDGFRQVDQTYAKPSDQTAFTDGFPFLIISLASLHALNQAMQSNLTMERFRPNLVIDGCPAYAEDRWRQIDIQGIHFRLPKPCSRCAIPTVNPQTAQREKEPLKTLNRLRKWDKKVYFGQNALHDTIGMLSTGTQVKVLRTGERQPPIAMRAPLE